MTSNYPPIVDNHTNLILSHNGHTFGETTRAIYRQPCHNYSKSGACPYGQKCNFIHSKLCIYYPQCSHGDQCQFLHYNWKTDTVRRCKNYETKCHNFTTNGDLCNWCMFNMCEKCHQDLTIYRRCHNEACEDFVPYRMCDEYGCTNKTQFKYCYGCYNNIEDWHDPYKYDNEENQHNFYDYDDTKDPAVPFSTTPTPPSTPVQSPRTHRAEQSYASVLVSDVPSDDEKDENDQHMEETPSKNDATVEQTVSNKDKKADKEANKKTDEDEDTKAADVSTPSIIKESYCYVMVPVPSSSIPDIPHIPDIPLVPSSIIPQPSPEYRPYFPPVVSSPPRRVQHVYPPVFFPGTIPVRQYYPDYNPAYYHYPYMTSPRE